MNDPKIYSVIILRGTPCSGKSILDSKHTTRAEAEARAAKLRKTCDDDVLVFEARKAA
jgi:hypothetical protein